MQILITGGAGFIGSHIALRLLESGHQIVIVDNLSNSSILAVERIEQLSGKRLYFYRTDICNYQSLDTIFYKHRIDAVIHMAALKSASDSLRHPLACYKNNVSGTLSLLQIMRTHRVETLIFSSSATVYGVPEKSPVSEDSKTGDTTSPYGTSKHFIEKVLQELAHARPEFSVTALRYFNPGGAHPTGLIGEHPEDIPCNLLPYLLQVASRQQTALPVFGNDYPTQDGTGVRDYIHVMDLAEGHIQALYHAKPGYRHYNLGTGVGHSVLEVVRAFEKITGVTIPLSWQPRRPGDVAACYADPARAQKELGWKAKRGIEHILRDAWHWHQLHPQGYPLDAESGRDAE